MKRGKCDGVIGGGVVGRRTDAQGLGRGSPRPLQTTRPTPAHFLHSCQERSWAEVWASIPNPSMVNARISCKIYYNGTASRSASSKTVHEEDTEITLYEGVSDKSSENIFLDKILIRARSKEDIKVNLLVENATVVVRAAVTRASALPESVIREIRLVTAIYQTIQEREIPVSVSA